MERQRIADYLSSLECDADELLKEMRTYAETHGVPIVRLETESFLRTMTAVKRPARILEIGTAIAYSTIVLAREQTRTRAGFLSLLPEEGDKLPRVVTIESWEKRIPIAGKNLRRAGLSDVVKLVHGDAGHVLKQLLEEYRDHQRGETGDRRSEYRFDLVFLDAAKGQYLNWLSDIVELMNEGGILLADNVLQNDTVMEPRVTVERRERTTHSRMREFLYEIKHSERLISSVLPLGDGVSVSVKR